MDTITFESLLSSEPSDSKEGVFAILGKPTTSDLDLKIDIKIEIHNSKLLTIENINMALEKLGQMTYPYQSIHVLNKTNQVLGPLFTTFRDQIEAIQQRNSLIHALKLEVTTPGQKSIDIWAALFNAVLHYFIEPVAGLMPAIQYNPSPNSGLAYDPKARVVYDAIEKMEKIGFEKFCEFILHTNSCRSQKKFIINNSHKLSAPFRLSCLEFLECFNHLQQQEEYKNKQFPFTNIALQCEETFTHTQGFYDAAYTFLSKNRNIEYFDIGLQRKHIFPSSRVYKEFCARYEEGMIPAHFKLPYDTHRKDFDDIHTRVNTKLKEATYKESDTKISETYDQLTTVSDKILDNWWKPLLPTQEKKQEPNLVYEQELELEKQAVITAEAMAQIDHQSDIKIEAKLAYSPQLNELLDEKRIKARPLCDKYLYYDAIVGTTRFKKFGKIDYFTPEACVEIECYIPGFLGGIVYDPIDPNKNKLPLGFCLIKKGTGENEKLILHYDATLAAAPQTQDGLRPLFSLNKNIGGHINEGSVEMFIGHETKKEDKEAINDAFCMFIERSASGMPKDYLSSLFVLLAALDRTTVPAIQQKFNAYKDILATLNGLNFKALREVVLKGRVKGIEVFLKSCQALKFAGLYDVFKSCFIDGSQHLIEFTTPESVALIAELAKVCLNAPKLGAWWNAILKSHIKARDDGLQSFFFQDKIKAFLKFCEELKKMGLAMDLLPLPGQLKPVSSIHAMLSNILDILKCNPKRAKEQLAYFQGEQGNDNAHYAVVVDKYSFVIAEMDLQPGKSADDKELTYSVKYSDLAAMANIIDQKLKPDEDKKETVDSEKLLDIEDTSAKGQALKTVLEKYKAVLAIFKFEKKAELITLFDELKKLNDPEKFFTGLDYFVGCGDHFSFEESLVLVDQLLLKGDFFYEGNRILREIQNTNNQMTVFHSLIYDLKHRKGCLQRYLVDFLWYLSRQQEEKQQDKKIDPTIFAHCMRFIDFKDGLKDKKAFVLKIDNSAVLKAINDTLNELVGVPQYGRILAGHISPEVFLELFQALKDLATSDPRALAEKARNFLTYKASAIYFYRYLGSTHTPLPIQSVRRVMKRVEKNKADYDTKALLLPLIAPALQGATCPFVKNEYYCDLIFSALAEKEDPKGTVQNLQFFPNEKISYNLRDLAGLVRYQKEHKGEAIDWKSIHGLGATAYQAFVNLGFRSQTKPPLALEFQTDEILELITSQEEFQGHQGSIFSALSLLDFKEGNKTAENCVSIFKSLAEKNPVLLNRLLSIINKINVESSTQFLNTASIKQLAQYLEKNPSISVDEGCGWVSQKWTKIRFDATLSGQTFTEDDFRKEIDQVRVMTIDAVKKFIEHPPMKFSLIVFTLKAIYKPEEIKSYAPNLNQALIDVTKEVSSSEGLLDLFDNMINDLDTEIYPKIPTSIQSMITLFGGKGKVSSLIFSQVYDPYVKIKEICIKKISEDFKQLTDKKKATLLSEQVKIALGDVDLKIKSQRNQFFDAYNMYKKIAEILEQNKQQPEFCQALCEALAKNKDKAIKQTILQLAHTILNEDFSFTTQTFLFKVCLKRDLDKAVPFVSHFVKIRAVAPDFIFELQKKFDDEKNSAGFFDFIELFSNLIEQLPKQTDFSSILKTLLKFPNEGRLKILTALQSINGPFLKRLILNFLNNMLLRDPNIAQSVDEVIQWMLLVAGATAFSSDKKIEVSDDQDQDEYQKFQNVNCPLLKPFIEKLQGQHMTLQDIFDEIDAKPKGTRDSEAERKIEAKEIDRLLRIEFSYIKKGTIDSIKQKFNDINAIDLSKLPRDALDTRLKHAMENYKNKQENAIVELLACLREWMYRTPPHRFPNAMQILSILTSFEIGRFTLLGIKTGQGKSIVCALQAAIMFSLGHSAVVLTSDNTLSKRDYKENEQFFISLGAKSTYLEKNSPAGTFKKGGINYASTGEFALYWQAAKKRGESLRRDPDGTKITMSLSLDEDDDFLLTKSGSDQFISTQKIEGLDDPAWMYEHINKFADFCAEKARYLNEDEKSNDPECKKLAEIYCRMAAKYADEINRGLQSVYGGAKQFDVKRDAYEITALEIHALHEYLCTKATSTAQKAALKREGFLSLLKKLIDSAKTVKRDIYPTWIKNETGRESKGFHVVEKVMLRGDVDCKERHIEIVQGGRPKKGYRYSNGDHQLLTKRVENELADDKGASFVYDPLSSPISIWSADTLIRKFQKDPNSVIVGSSGSPGSPRQIQEKMERYNFITAIHPPQEEKPVTKPGPIYTKDSKSHLSQVIAAVFAHKHNKDEKSPPKAVLILTQNTQKIAALQKELTEKLHGQSIEVLVLDAKSDEKEGSVLEKVPYGLAISTMSRRGADIKMTEEEASEGTKLIHSEGLKVIDMDVVTTTEEQQGEGRTNRRGVGGIYQQIFDMSEIKSQYPEHFASQPDLQHLSDAQCKGIISNIQQFMDAQSEQRRNIRLMYEQIVYALEKPFHTFQKEFEKQRKASTGKAEKKWTEALMFLTVKQQEALAHLAALWEELPRSLARDLPADELKEEWSATRRMNYLHDRIKTYAVSLWENYYRELTEKWTSIHKELDAKKEVPPLRDTILNYDLLASLMEIRRRHEIGVGPISHEHKMKDDKKTTPDTVEEMTQPIQADLINYQRKWRLSSDRKAERARFFQEITSTTVPPMTFVSLLSKLNSSYRGSLKKDIDYANNGWWRLYYYFTLRRGKRSTTSDYREILLSNKQKLLKKCPLDQLEPVIKEELKHIADTLDIETGRPIYKGHLFAGALSDITKLRDQILQGLQEVQEVEDSKQGPIQTENLGNLVVLLMNTLSNLQPILENFEHNKLSSLKDLNDQSLSILFQNYASMKTTTNLTKGSIACKLSETIRQVNFPAVTTRTERRNFFWQTTHSTFDSYVPNARLVPALDGMELLSKYYCHAILNDLYNKLVREFHAIDISITKIPCFSAGNSAEFQLQFSTVDRAGTGQTDIHQLNLEINFKLKIVKNKSFKSQPKEEASLKRLVTKHSA